MKSQMQAHQKKAPICSENVKPTSQRHTAVKWQEIKHIAGHHNTAVHLHQHCKQDEQINTKRYNTNFGVSSLKNASVPTKVENMVGDKKEEHSRPDPFMCYFTPKLISVFSKFSHHLQKQKKLLAEDQNTIILFHLHHSVTHTNVSLDILRGIRRWLQFFPQCCHKDAEGSNIIIPTPSPNILRNKGMRQYFPYILGQQAQ